MTRLVFRLFATLAIGAALAACNVAGSGSGTSGSGVSTVPKKPLKSNWEFWVYNKDGDYTLHMENTHQGKCMYAEIPTTDIAPGGSWSGVVDTKGSGSCAVEDSVQDIKFSYPTRNPYLSLTLSYIKHWDDTSSDWAINKISSTGAFFDTRRDPPVKTDCQRENGLDEVQCDMEGDPPPP